MLDGDAESSDDGGHSGAVFYGPISGFVKEARGPGNAIAMSKVTYHGTRHGESKSSESTTMISRQIYVV
jgi:hypothetical protein